VCILIRIISISIEQHCVPVTVLRSINSTVNCVWNKEGLPYCGRNLSLYLFIKRVINLTVIITTYIQNFIQYSYLKVDEIN